MLAVANTNSKQQNGGAMCSTRFFCLFLCGKLFFLLCYNSFMEYITVVIDSFWAIMGQVTTVFTPILAIYIIFRLIKTAIRG